MQFAANTHCILSGTLPDIINENHKTLWHIHYVRFSPSSVSRFPPSASAHRRFAYSFRAAHSVLSLSLSSPLRDKITTTDARASTSELSSLVCAFHDGGDNDDVSSTFCSSRFDGNERARAEHHLTSTGNEVERMLIIG